MKLIIGVLCVLSLFVFGCTGDQIYLSDDGSAVNEKPSPSSLSFENDVRLTGHGFDAGEINIPLGSSLTVHIIGEDVDSHYLTVATDRAARKQLIQGDEVNIAFDSEGVCHVSDETGKQILVVNVV